MKRVYIITFSFLLSLSCLAQFTTSASDVIFILTSPALPTNVKKIDLIEPGESSWKFWGIELDAD